MDSQVIQSALVRISDTAKRIADSTYNVFNPPQKPTQPAGNAVNTKFGQIPFQGPQNVRGAMQGAPTPTPQPTQQPQPQGNDGFVFDYGSMPVDQEWRAKGPRPNFNPQQPPAQIGRIIRDVFPHDATAAATIASTENATFDSNRADNVNSDGTVDRGIFQVNQNTFNGLMQRQGNKLKELGITSFDDMRDPRKNALVARMIRDGARAYRPETNPEGWGGWFGWQDTGYDLNKGYYTKGDRVEHAEKKKKERLKVKK